MTSEKEFIEKLVSIYQEIDLLSEDIKSVLTQIKDNSMDVKTIQQIAKAISKNKLQDIEDQYEKFLTLSNNLK